MPHTNKDLKISIVIPNWNGEELLRKNLAKVIKTSKEVVEIIVVDDHSTDRSVDFIRSCYPSVIVIKKDKQEGFASSINLGVTKSKGDIVVLLNTDINPTEGYLKPLRKHFENPSIFGVGFLDLSHEGNRLVARGKGLASWKKGYFIHSKGDEKSGRTAWVSGGSGAFRKQIWDRLGGMDSLFNPFYWEDIDISYRALKSGYSLEFDPNCLVHHYHHEGKISQSFPSRYIRKIAYRNQYIFIWKNLSDRSIWLEHLIWLPIRLIQSLVNLDFPMIFGFLSALAHVPSILMSRAKTSTSWITTDKKISLG